MIKKKCIGLIIIIVFAALFVATASYYLSVVSTAEVAERKSLNEWYLQNFNYSFSGIVRTYYERKKERGNQFGIVQLDLLTTDVNDYPNDTASLFFCKINNGTAKVMIPILYELKRTRTAKGAGVIVPGDTLAYDGKTDRFMLYFDGDSISFAPNWLFLELEDRYEQGRELK